MNHQREICPICKKKMVFNHYYPMATREHPFKSGYMCQKCHDNPEAAKGGSNQLKEGCLDAGVKTKVSAVKEPPRKSLTFSEHISKMSNKDFEYAYRSLREGGR